MNTSELIQNRYSVRAFDAERQIPEEAMSQIIEAARLAPSAHNYQPYHIYRLKSKQAKDKIADCYDRMRIRDAAEILLVVGEDPKSWVYKDEKDSSVYIDSAIATAYMQLQAWDLGIGSVWVCAFDRTKVAELFNLEWGVQTPHSLLVLGYEADGKTKPRKIRKSLNEIYTEL